MGEPRISRRAFELGTLVLIPLCYGVVILAAAIRYLMPLPPSRRRSRMDLGPARKFQEGEVARVGFNGRQVYVLHDGKEFRALDATCTHLSCRVNWVSERRVFLCPCHLGTFAASGERISGPPDRPLAVQPFELTPDGRIVLLDQRGKA